MGRNLGIAEAVEGLREELMRAFWQNTNEAMRFEVKVVEVELEVAVTLEATANAEAKWWVVSFGAEARAERSGTHKVKLSLMPKLREGDLLIGSPQRSKPEAGSEADPQAQGSLGR